MVSQIINRDIRIPAVIISLLLSLWCIVIDPVINNDGFLYILLAETVQDGNYSNAFNIFRWPFYSFILAGLGNLSGLSLEITAYLLNIILAMVIVFGFISIVRLTGGDQRVIIIAAIVILLFPGINRYRSFISRDFGYLAFYMLGLFVFFKHLIKPEWYWPILWSVFLVVAALFRIEAIAILISLPFISWFVFAESKEQRVKIGAMFGLALVGSFLLFAWWFAGSHLNNSNFSGVEGVYDLVKRFMAGSITEYSVRLEQMRILLTQYSKNYAVATLFAAFIIILFSEVVRSITVPYLITAIYGWRKFVVFSEDRVKNAWILMLWMQFIILSAAMFKYFLITGRFPLALSLTVLLIVPFILSNMYQQWKDDRKYETPKKWFFPVIVLLIIIISLQGLNTFTGKNHYKEGGLWIKKNIKPNEKLLSNEASVVYYAGRNPSKQQGIEEWKKIRGFNFSLDIVARIIESKKGSDYKYIAVGIKQKNNDRKQEIIDLVGNAPVKILKNKYDDELLIFVN